MEKYEISKETIAIIGQDDDKTRVLEYDTDKILNEKAYQVMDYSCSYFGSSYQGRVDGSRKMLGANYKLPIIVEESSNMIFFPTTSPTLSDCSWISLNAVEFIDGDSENSIINFKNGKKIDVPISKSSLENQILRATRLQYLLNSRKSEKK
ncbi:MAG: competence protein [Firmicutes bacterium]|nr:competence protein [Bacillota bacterium]